MKRTKLLALSVLTAIMILGSSLALASPPADEAGEGAGPVIGGGIGRNLKR